MGDVGGHRDLGHVEDVAREEPDGTPISVAEEFVAEVEVLWPQIAPDYVGRGIPIPDELAEIRSH